MVTQDDIARKLNISRTTVSRAIQGKNVSEDTRQKVLEAIADMGYMPNTIAAGLASKGRKTVYVFTLVTIDEGYAKNMIEGIEEVARLWRDYNFDIKIVLTDMNKAGDLPKEQIEQFYEIINNQTVSGVIFSALSQTNIDIVKEECSKRNIPLMTLDMIYYCDELCHVGPDYFQLGIFSGAYLSQLIMKRGKVLTLSYDEGYEIGRERMNGFFAKMQEEANIEVYNVDITKMSKEAYWEVLDEKLEAIKPAAIYAPYHMEYIAEYLERHGKDINDYVLIANGVNENIEKYLFTGMINGVVSARPYYLGAVAANNFFKYFFRTAEMKRGRIDVMVDIYIAENYKRFDKLF